jgi:hypothetical protein
MPHGPKGEKRPADVIGNAVRVMEIATGQREEEYEAKPEKDEAAAALGHKGVRSRAYREASDRGGLWARWPARCAPSVWASTGPRVAGEAP